MDKTKYTCIGSVCSSCDIQHRTIEAAVRCCDRHHARVVASNGANAYSDRDVRRVDGEELDDWEIDEYYRVIEDKS